MQMSPAPFLMSPLRPKVFLSTLLLKHTSAHVLPLAGKNKLHTYINRQLTVLCSLVESVFLDTKRGEEWLNRMVANIAQI
jgi:hypothetical protein